MEQSFPVRRAQRRAASKLIATVAQRSRGGSRAASNCAQNRFPFRATGAANAAPSSLSD